MHCSSDKPHNTLPIDCQQPGPSLLPHHASTQAGCTTDCQWLRPLTVLTDLVHSMLASAPLPLLLALDSREP